MVREQGGADPGNSDQSAPVSLFAAPTAAPNLPLDLVTFTARLDDAVATSRASGWRDRLERVLTDGYSEVLLLETTRRRVRRRLQVCLEGMATDPKAVHEASALSEEITELTHQIRTLRELLERASRSARVA